MAPGAERLFESLFRKFLELSDRFDTEFFQAGVGDFSDSRNTPGRERSQESFFGSGRNPHQTARLSLLAGNFGDESRGGQTAGARQLRRHGNFRKKLMRRRERRPVKLFGAS